MSDDTYLNENQPRPIKVAKELSEDTLTLFAQDPGYVKRWRPRLEGKQPPLHFNFYAILFGAIWCVFRKLRRVAAILIELQWSVEIAAILIAIHVFAISRYDTGLQGVIAVFFSMLLVRIPFGLLADAIYYQQAKDTIEKLAETRLPDEYFVSAVKAQGGIDFPAALVVAGALGVANMLASAFL